MSGAGKTYWSKRFEKVGYRRFSVDEFITVKLNKELKSKGFKGTEDVSYWMGQPYDKRYPKTSKKYLHFENEAMFDIFAEINKLGENSNVVIDTTGSVIYLDDKIMNKLDTISTVIHLSIPESVQKEMYNLYLKDPKPVIWGHSYRKNNGESNEEALCRCYPDLLQYRLRKYKKNSDFELEYKSLRKPGFKIHDFLQLIK